MKKVKLRSEPRYNLEGIILDVTLRYYGFYDCRENRNGGGIQHVFEKQVDGKVIYDHTTSLCWQRCGSVITLTFDEAYTYVDQLNSNRYGGYDDWRLPTLEEAMSLMETGTKNGNLYIDPLFNARQSWIWTSDKTAVGRVWCVGFITGYCYDTSYVDLDAFYVRAVRSKED